MSLCLLTAAACAQTGAIPSIQIDWHKPVAALRTSPTLQVVVNPLLRPGSPIRQQAFRSLNDLGADYVRYVPWFPYPKLAVAELQPPTATHTSWNFDLIDPITEDFLSATKGHSVILNFSTIPAWMFTTSKPVTYPDNPNTADWNYTQGNHLRDPSMQELAGYYARLVGWYTQGGFTDELGKQHVSGHHYDIAYWEFLNEVESEHETTPQQYTRRYDAVVSAIRKVDPKIKFIGLALADPGAHPEFFSYFLEHSHHRPGIPLDMISYHFYASPTVTQGLDDWQYTFFDQADHFLTTVRYVEAIRKKLSPETRTTLDEIGSILPTDNTSEDADSLIPPKYWNLSGALYAYLFIETAKLGIDVIGESQLVGYPSQFPSVSMVDWNTGQPNARLRVLELIHRSFSAGDQMVSTKKAGSAFAAQAFLTPGFRKLMVINKRNRDITLTLPDALKNGRLEAVGLSTGQNDASAAQLSGTQLLLHPFTVCVVAVSR